jgi:PAS domain S-box-containing protein
LNSAAIPAPSSSANLYRTYFEHANLGFALTSPEKGWLHVNPRLCEMLGYSASDLRQLTWADLTHPDDLPAEAPSRRARAPASGRRSP